MTLKLHATPEEVMRAVEALRVFAESHRVPEETLHRLMLVLEECASNIVNHGLQRDGQQTFEVRFEHSPSGVVIELSDAGPAFDPTKAAERESHAKDDDLPGGWGIHLVRRCMDEVRYTRASGKNILRLTKKLAPAAGLD